MFRTDLINKYAGCRKIFIYEFVSLKYYVESSRAE
jgi:hypothetical protein